jgi:hypothetical protein
MSKPPIFWSPVPVSAMRRGRIGTPEVPRCMWGGYQRRRIIRSDMGFVAQAYPNLRADHR